MNETCFVIMPISTQHHGNHDYSDSDLKNIYNDLIKNALENARPGLEIVRADEVTMPGSISNDIFSRLMFSKYVVADISLPNPNVFYELGIRHAIHTGTILLKNKNINTLIFDISHSRYIEYENTASGLRELTNKLKEIFSSFDKAPENPDNQFIELASYVKYQYPRFVDTKTNNQKDHAETLEFLEILSKNPKTLRVFMNKNISQREKMSQISSLIMSDPEALASMIQYMTKFDTFSIGT